MNISIFKRSRMSLFVAVTAVLLASCDKDIDSNPTFEPNNGSFTLNTPANAANNTYDLASASGLNLTCTQPDYNGVPYVVKYFVQVSLNKDFGKSGEIDYKQLETSYITASMNVDPLEINNAMISLFRNANGDVAYPAKSRPLYIRLLATPVNLAGTPQDSVFSNVITLPRVLATYIAPKLTYPQQLYLVGSSIGDGKDLGFWSYWKKMGPVYGNEPQKMGDFYSIIYVPDGGMFKWGEAEGDWRGFSRVAEFDDQAKAGVHAAANDDNIQFDKGGWYLVYVTTKLGSSAVAHTFHIYPAAAYVIGSAAGENWDDANPDWQLKPNADGIWESPVLKGSGELRAYIKVPGLDWWKTEFTLYKGSLYWRVDNIVNSWEENVGADYSVKVNPGQKLFVNFNISTGEVK